MTNIQRSRKKGGRGFKFFITFLFVLFLVFNYFKWTPFHNFVLNISSPVFKVKDVALSPFDNLFSYFKSKKELEKRNEELEKEISNLKIEFLSSEILKYEYQSLVNQGLENKEDSETQIELAKVILKPPFSSFDNLLISGDFSENIIGEKVFYRNIFIGEIKDIKNRTAVIQMASASGNKTPAKLKDGKMFEVVGRGSGQYEMTLPKDVEVKEGDPIIYPEEDVVLFGIVNKVFATEDDLFNKVLFNLPVDFSDLNYLQIGEPFDILD